MVPLLKAADHLLSRLAGAKSVAIGLDYDGTLVPIKPTPAEAVLSRHARNVLTELASGKGIELLLITGRRARDLKDLIGIEELEIVGNHGLSRIRAGRLEYHPDAESFMQNKELIIGRIEHLLSSLPCVVLEDKGPGLALHYRSCPDERREEVRDALLAGCRRLSDSLPLRLREGKMVVELVPVTSVDKGGTMLDWLAELARGRSKDDIVVIYAGDDITDEDVFSIAGADWITIQVGRREGRTVSASFLAEDHEQLLEFLSLIAKQRTSGK
jgi:trehalose 6-phosphate phosphatase